MNRDESRAILQEFIQEHNQTTGDDLTLTDTLTASAPGIDATPAKETADAVTPKPSKKRATLRVLEGGAKAVERTNIPSLSDLPTPGGIAPLLVLALFLVFALVPSASGQSRLQLMWAAFMGHANITPGQGSAVVNGAPVPMQQPYTPTPY